jgi:hypothetical protein
MPKKLENMSVEELQDELHSLDEQKQDIRAKQLEVHGFLDRAVARERVEQMNPAERESLKQAISDAGNIESQEG